ncbi:Uncharacterised protein [Salmonella enterica subsp. enterica serovar Bovismorbificans]|uniref:Uncharacterized protein n=1 Tax=Salmonella enterica subsp. enterica serovar Bovismorbificans TaxID=58097 RepID=A0A655E109_SALET|nr:Uncharacterised protein [Salmonella enterica subsp. enterica serovar Bovismorbificans]CQB91247.1 Uncharacterised protein [Salmonella enterica subsp. enterica serovar Typhimurium str. DT104]CQF19330.1 Uncharacterised protein [Salmonella enterica subsp. enterica serovar Typhimurium str. DT104]CQG45708.1 Uncharacterised protein [Salmonella enterica subsp. enterica serovar Typhimurium str. DT104]
MFPASAYATTSGGDASQFVFTSGWIRPSKFRLPESTAPTVRSPFLIAVSIGSGNGPEFPIQVVQP